MSHASLIWSRLRSPRALGAGVLLCAALTSSCRDLDGFDSKPGQAYCGAIGLGIFHDGFVADNMPSTTLQLALTLDMSKLSSLPGQLSSNDPLGMCGTADAPQVLFANAPVRAIPEVDNDVLSSLTFGEGHEHDFFAWVDSTCQGTMLAVVSLMKNNQVELRLFKPAPMPPPRAPVAQRPGFALFHLYPKPLYRPENEGGCGFPTPS